MSAVQKLLALYGEPLLDFLLEVARDGEYYAIEGGHIMPKEAFLLLTEEQAGVVVPDWAEAELRAAANPDSEACARLGTRLHPDFDDGRSDVWLFQDGSALIARLEKPPAPGSGGVQRMAYGHGDTLAAANRMLNERAAALGILRPLATE